MRAELILSIGTGHFSRTLFEDLQRMLDLRQMVVYRFRPGAPVELLFAESDNDDDNMRRAIDVYCNHLGPQDPIRPSLYPAHERQMVIHHVRAEDIESASFRHELYRVQNLASKIAIVVRRPNDSIVVSLFRGDDTGALSDEEWDHLNRSAGYIAAAVERHVDLLNTPRIIDWSEMLGSIDDGPPLSRQEIMVCSQILDGYFNEAIALKMGISVHSVITYRRRAFSKLGVTSQNELFSLLIRRHMQPGSNFGRVATNQTFDMQRQQKLPRYRKAT